MTNLSWGLGDKMEDWVERLQRRSPRHVEQLRHGVLAHRFGKLARLPLAQPTHERCRAPKHKQQSQSQRTQSRGHAEVASL